MYNTILMDIKSTSKRILDVFFLRDLLDLKRGRFWVKWTRIWAIAVREFVKDNCSVKASALTFVTLVSIVPVLAFAFSIGKGLGFHEHLKEFLMSKIMSGLGFKGETGAQQVVIVVEKIFEYVDRTNFQTLGAIGTIMLIYLVIRLLSYIESTFNDIWGVAVPRSIIRKFTDYISIIVVFPLFVLLAATGTAMLTSHKFIGLLENLGTAGVGIKILLRYSPYLFLWVAFFAIYMVMPNTRVQFSSALIGGIIAGTSWQVAQWAYFHFQVSISRYNAIYSTFAALPIFLIWLQLSWMVLLFGAEIAFAHQMVDKYRFGERDKIAGQRTAEVLALSVVSMIARNFLQGNKPLGLKDISEALGVSPALLSPVIMKLCQKNILCESSGSGNFYLLTRSPDKINTVEVLRAVTGDVELDLNRISSDVKRFFEDMEETLTSKFRSHTVSDLLIKKPQD